MKRTLFLVRHAKSSRDDVTLPDKERPLADRGKRDAPMMGERLAKRQVRPDLILSSPARRAFSTAEIIAKELNYRAEDIVDFAWTAWPGYAVYTDKWKHVSITLLIPPERKDQHGSQSGCQTGEQTCGGSKKNLIHTLLKRSPPTERSRGRPVTCASQKTGGKLYR